MQIDSIDWTAHPWAFWLVLALVAGLLEMTLPYFTFSFVSVAALMATLVAFKAGAAWQMIVFGLGLMLSLLVVRPRLLKRLQKSHSHAHMPSRSQALVQQMGVVSEAIDRSSGRGRVLVNGQDWKAESEQPLALGQTVIVIGHDGIVLKVKEK